jgi:mxaJ protein
MSPHPLASWPTSQGPALAMASRTRDDLAHSLLLEHADGVGVVMVHLLRITSIIAILGLATGASSRGELRVCADPNNLPFSNAAGEGFENRIAQIVGRALGQRVVYTWWPQRRGFLRQTLRVGTCDVVMGIPASFEMALPTRPYYRSSYVFVSRRDRHLALSSFDDPRLRRLRIGIQLTGNDYDNPPPAQALAVRHLADNVRGFMVYGDYTTKAPQRDVVDAVVDGRIDTAVVWGPVAGYFAQRVAAPLELRVASPPPGRNPTPLTFAIAMGVRRDDQALHAALDSAIASRRQDIRDVLLAYGVPLIETP